MNFAKRLNLLGTETAFAVSNDAKEYARAGNIVYPFHLGDINISTPENILQATQKAMTDGKTGYNPAAGVPSLRSVISEHIGNERKINYNIDNVIIQPGGKPVISKFIQALMNPGDGVLYPNPGYPIYESQIEFHGGCGIPYRFLTDKDGFKIDRELVEKSLSKNVKLFIYNNYQNPMGAESSNEEMEWIANLAQKHDLWVLSDEAYFNIRYQGSSNSIASFPGMQERTIILFTFSKKYAMTGWRIGAAIGPSKIMKIFEKLAVNDESCTNHFIQYGAIEAITGDQTGSINILNKLKLRRDILSKLLNDIPGISIYVPNSTFYLFPDVTIAYKMLRVSSYKEFRNLILHNTGVSICTRDHFGTPLEYEDRKYVRFAYSGISRDKIKEGIGNLKDYLALHQEFSLT